jgi:nucleotide-binding universal stress UspA family protein
MPGILVPTDYSDHSYAVTEFAADLAARVGAELHVLYVWETMPHFPPDLRVTTPTGPRRLEELVHETAAREMKDFLARCRIPDSVRVESHIDSGAAAPRILRWVAKGSFDLVVIGTHGGGGVKHWVLGSVAERVVRLSPIPVIAVPERRHPHAAGTPKDPS